MSNTPDSPNPLHIVWWVLRTLLMSLAALFFFSFAIGPQLGGWPLGRILFLTTGGMILYVECWSWWNRFARRKEQ